MKKLIVLTANSLLCTACFAEDRFDAMHDRSFMFDLLHVVAALTCLVLVSTLLLRVLQTILDQRIKSRLVETQASNETIGQLLRQERKDDRRGSLKWMFLLAGIGASLLLMTDLGTDLPVSLAILCLGLAAGFGGYYFFTKKTGNK